MGGGGGGGVEPPVTDVGAVPPDPPHPASKLATAAAQTMP